MNNNFNINTFANNIVGNDTVVKNYNNGSGSGAPTHRISELEHGNNIRKRALIIVNLQNCFFKGGSFAQIPNKEPKTDIKNEKELINRVNSLINLYEADSDYFKAGLTGSAVIAGELTKTKDVSSEMEHFIGSYPTGSRKKYFFDSIVYTQTAYSPDHYSFASHHYLREKKGKINQLMADKNIDYISAKQEIKDDALDNHYWSYINSNFENTGMLQFKDDRKLYPDHALIDGSDVIIENNKCYRGIDFHPRLSLMPLYRPNQNIDKSVYINPPQLSGRGMVLWLGGDINSDPKSAFMTTLNQSTGLHEYLGKNDIKDIYIVGLFRDMMIESTAVDAVESNLYNNVNLIYDATMSYNIPNNDTGVNNKHFFNNEEDISEYSDEDDPDNKEELENRWASNLINKGVKIINYRDILKNMAIGKENISCGMDQKGLIKNIDSVFQTFTGKTSRNDL